MSLPVGKQERQTDHLPIPFRNFFPMHSCVNPRLLTWLTTGTKKGAINFTILLYILLLHSYPSLRIFEIYEHQFTQYAKNVSRLF